MGLTWRISNNGAATSLQNGPETGTLEKDLLKWVHDNLCPLVDDGISHQPPLTVIGRSKNKESVCESFGGRVLASNNAVSVARRRGMSHHFWV